MSSFRGTQALVDLWLVQTGGAAGMEAAPTLLVSIRNLSPDTSVVIAANGTVLEPCSGAFDVTVSPGRPVQAAVDR